MTAPVLTPEKVLHLMEMLEQEFSADPIVAWARVCNVTRCVRRVKVTSTSSSRKYFCAACGSFVASESVMWPKTKRSREAIAEHESSCAEWKRLEEEFHAWQNSVLEGGSNDEHRTEEST